MAKIPQNDYTICTLKKHKGEKWRDVVEEDPEYVEWLIGNVELSAALYEYLNDLMDEYGYD